MSGTCARDDLPGVKPIPAGGEPTAAPADTDREAGGAPDHERHFGADELFFSATDRKGIIRAGNDVFVRVSAYERSELVGRPHNIIRHMDTPRCVFRLLWDYLDRGEPIAAYVKNRAKDGGHYWVLAIVVPAGDGYLSVRIKPASEVFPIVKAMYAELRAEERRIEGPTGHDRKPAIEASTAMLADLLSARGFEDYDAFMRYALATELRLRHATLGHTRPYTEAVALAHEHGYHGELRRLSDACAAVHEFLCELFAELDEYESMNASLAEKAHFVLDLADDVRLFALNAMIAADRLGADGRALGAVARLVGASSSATGALTRSTADGIARAIDVLHELEFQISIATVQSEMAMFFAQELRVGELARLGGNVREHMDANVAVFLDCLATAIDGVMQRLHTLDTELEELGPHLGRLATGLDALRALEINGRIEAARIGHVGGLDALFADIAGRVGSACTQVEELQALALAGSSHGLPAARTRLRPHLARLHAASSQQAQAA
jgi:aerotaxis receptor